MAAKLKFPNRPCPKCGKPIHTRSMSHDCGWKAEATAANSPKTKPATAESPKSKLDAVRLLIAESSDIMPLEITEQLKRRFKMKMNASTASNYKRIALRERGNKKNAGPKGRPAAHAPVKASSVGGISIADIQAVKELAERLGAEKLRQLAEVLG